MTLAEHAAGVDGGHGRRVEALDERAGVRGGVDAAAAEQHQRAFGAGQPGRGSIEPGGRRGRRIDRGPLDRRVGDRLGHHVQRNLDMHRAGAGAFEHREGAGDDLVQRLAGVQGVAEHADPGQRALLVGQLVQAALATAQGVATVDAGNHQHGYRVGQRLGHRGGDVGHSRAADDQTGRRLAAGAGVAVGHEPGALLVARRDVAQRAVAEAAVELDGVHPGDAEHGVDAVGLEQLEQALRAGRHERTSASELAWGGAPNGSREKIRSTIGTKYSSGSEG